MRLVSFVRVPRSPPQAGVVLGDLVVPAADLMHVAREEMGIPTPSPFRERASASMEELLTHWDPVYRCVAAALGRVERSPTRTKSHGIPLEQVQLKVPLAQPPAVRDFYAFEEHVRRARGRRGLEVPPEWYEAPVFYFSNPSVLFGPGDEVPSPRATKMLDYELEVAWVMGQDASDIDPQTAEGAIAGLTIMNDWSARDVQTREMAVGLGPSKGKDFATSLGPQIVTLDELQPRRRGDAYDLQMVARVNGEERSRGSLQDLHWTLGQMTAHASRDSVLRAGDVLATGTVGTGSLLDLDAKEWLKLGDVVELEVDLLGTLTNKIGPPRRR